MISVAIARFIVKRAIKASVKGETVNVPATMKAIDALGDQDGKVEMSDVVTAISDYIEDAGDVIGKIWDSLTEL